MKFALDLFLFMGFIALLVGLVAWVNAIDNKAIRAQRTASAAGPDSHSTRDENRALKPLPVRVPVGEHRSRM